MQAPTLQRRSSFVDEAFSKEALKLFRNGSQDPDVEPPDTSIKKKPDVKMSKVRRFTSMKFEGLLACLYEYVRLDSVD